MERFRPFALIAKTKLLYVYVGHYVLEYWQSENCDDIEEKNAAHVECNRKTRILFFQEKVSVI